jgi:hypothetical protein
VVVLVPAGVVTVTSTVPAACAGAVAWSSVAETNVTDVAGMPPNETVAPAMKCRPVIVTVVPPAAGPPVGEMPETRGTVVSTNAAPSPRSATQNDGCGARQRLGQARRHVLAARRDSGPLRAGLLIVLFFAVVASYRSAEQVTLMGTFP